VGQVADFIAASPRERDQSPRSRRAFAALQLLDVEEGAEATEKRMPPLPPELPPDARIPELPSMMLGPAISTRTEVTERMSVMPMTHPLANSIAPGGSRVSARPPSPRTGARWQGALGGAALLLLGGGASHYLQSRGEHHAAAAGAHSEQVDEPTPSRTLPEPSVRQAPAPELRAEPPVAEPAAQTSAAPQTGPTVTAGAVATKREADLPSAPQVSPDERTISDDAALTIAEASAEAPARAVRERELRVAMGAIQLRKSRRALPDAIRESDLPLTPEREQVIASMNAVIERLRECVNGAHGVADVTLTVRGSGVVSHALVEGPFAESMRGSCIARTLRDVQLPRFRTPLVRIAYPIEL
jgi:hypothetical protein